MIKEETIVLFVALTGNYIKIQLATEDNSEFNNKGYE